MLTAQLRELERDGNRFKKSLSASPPKVEYSLTKYGQSLKPFIELSCSLGNTHVKHIHGNGNPRRLLNQKSLV